MTELSKVAGGLNAYEFHVEMALHFHCDDCGEHLECPVTKFDISAPHPPWATREGKRAMALGWYVPPLTADGSLRPECFCPSCTKKRGLIVQNEDAKNNVRF
jgi:hypothetical protein